MVQVDQLLLKSALKGSLHIVKIEHNSGHLWIFNAGWSWMWTWNFFMYPPPWKDSGHLCFFNKCFVKLTKCLLFLYKNTCILIQDVKVHLWIHLWQTLPFETLCFSNTNVSKPIQIANEINVKNKHASSKYPSSKHTQNKGPLFHKNFNHVHFESKHMKTNVKTSLGFKFMSKWTLLLHQNHSFKIIIFPLKIITFCIKTLNASQISLFELLFIFHILLSNPLEPPVFLKKNKNLISIPLHFCFHF